MEGFPKTLVDMNIVIGIFIGHFLIPFISMLLAYPSGDGIMIYLYSFFVALFCLSVFCVRLFVRKSVAILDKWLLSLSVTTLVEAVFVVLVMLPIYFWGFEIGTAIPLVLWCIGLTRILTIPTSIFLMEKVLGKYKSVTE